MKTNEVLETIKARRSVRAYDRKQIPADDLNAILEAGAYAPSGGTVRRIAVTIMPQPWSSCPMNPSNGGPGWIVPVLSRICFWQPLHWASLPVGSISSVRPVMIRRYGPI